MGHAQPVCTGGTIEMDLVGGIQANLAQPSTQFQSKLLILDKALEGVATHLKVRPLLVDLLLLAIDDLLNLLVLDMRLDQLAGANGLGIAKDTRRPTEDIVCRGHIVGRLQDEPVLGPRVSTGDSLSRFGFAPGGFDGEGRTLNHAWLDGAFYPFHDEVCFCF